MRQHTAGADSGFRSLEELDSNSRTLERSERAIFFVMDQGSVLQS